MIYATGLALAVLVGFLTGVGLWLYGMHSVGIDIASGVIAACVAIAFFIIWYAAWSSAPNRDKPPPSNLF